MDMVLTWSQKIGFSPGVPIQLQPTQIGGLKGITNLAAGAQHVLAIDYKCNMYSWGYGNEGQLGRLIPVGISSLRPGPVTGLPVRGAKAQHVACGARTSFALDQNGRLYSWGRNNLSQLGVQVVDGERIKGNLPDVVSTPQLVEDLIGRRVIDVAGGRYHSLACTENGELFTWGLSADGAVGLSESVLEEQEGLVLDEVTSSYIVTYPIQVPGEYNAFTPRKGHNDQSNNFTDVENIVAVAAGKHHSIAVDEDGIAYTFGRSDEWQTGQGPRNCTGIPETVYSTDMNRAFIQFADGGRAYSIFAGVQRTSDLVRDDGEDVL